LIALNIDTDSAFVPLCNIMSTVIIGGGIIGLSTAYYLSLSKPPSSSQEIHIIDSSPELLASASGYAGGFVALDWFTPHVESIGALSFRLHRELAEQHGGARKWGYAGSHAYSLSMNDTSVDGTGKKGKSGDWILEGTSRANEVRTNSEAGAEGSGVKRADIVNADGSPAVFTPQQGGTLETIAGPEECAQIEPRELCQFLLEETKKRGVRLHLATRAVEVLKDQDDVLKGLRVGMPNGEENEIQCKNIVLTAGAWTPRVFKTLFPQSKTRIPIEPLAGHSIVVKSPRYTTPFIDPYKRNIGGSDNWLCYSIYAGPTRHWDFATEAYARLARNGESEIWLGGVNDSKLPLPEVATDVKELIDPKSVAIVRRTIVQLTGLSKEGRELHQDDLETVRESLCFRPVSQTGNPIVTKIEESDLGGLKVGNGGVWIGSGHGPWGISLSLGTGLVLSELIEGKQTSADISHLGLS
jgi:glycine/D-amino acid oxidase-like deaminating enzyme